MHMPISSPGLSDYGPDRCKQINTLLIFNENVSTIQQDVHYSKKQSTCEPHVETHSIFKTLSFQGLTL